jgi:hypothetical protein
MSAADEVIKRVNQIFCAIEPKVDDKGRAKTDECRY